MRLVSSIEDVERISIDFGRLYTPCFGIWDLGGMFSREHLNLLFNFFCAVGALCMFSYF